MTSLIKARLRRHIPWLLNMATPAVAGWLIRRRPYWIDRLPPGKSMKFHGYLGNYTVMIDRLYPMEVEMLSGIYDEVTVKIIDRFVRPGDVCFDIGANVGAITLAFARASGETGKVFAFEPGPPILERLKKNVALNPSLKSVVHIQQIGISDRPGYLNWTEDMSNRGNAGLLGAEGIKVPVITLDEFCQRNAISRLNFIKVDVEGMEHEVFSGAKVLLQNLNPILYFETLQPFVEVRGFDIFGEIERLLKAYSYTLFKIDEEANIMATTSSDLSANTLALPKALVSKLGLD